MDGDAYLDWIVNDLPMELNGMVLGGQINDALEFYNKVAENAYANIHVTGHSLGGLLADIVSSYSRCRGTSFNAVTALDCAYYSYPEEMGRNFRGVNRWTFVDYINPHDYLAGNYEAFEALKNGDITVLFGGADLIKVVSYVDCEENGLFTSHSMSTLLRTDKPEMYNIKSSKRPDGIIVRKENKVILSFANVYLGTNKGETIGDKNSVTDSMVIYGGDGDDKLYGGMMDDTLIPGSGNDWADGGLGNDIYIVYKGNGTLEIEEHGGNNTIKLMGFKYEDLRVEYGDHSFRIYDGNTCIVTVTHMKNGLIYGSCKFKLLTDDNGRQLGKYPQ